jgi:hypothetical protein
MKLEDFGGAAQCMPPQRRDETPGGTVLTSRVYDLTNEQLIMRLRMLTEQASPLIGRLIHHDAEASQFEDGCQSDDTNLD